MNEMFNYDEVFELPFGWRRHLSGYMAPSNDDPGWYEWQAAWQLFYAIRSFEQSPTKTNMKGLSMAAHRLRNPTSFMLAPTVPSDAGVGMNITTDAIDPQLGQAPTVPTVTDVGIINTTGAIDPRLIQAPLVLGNAGPVNTGPVNAGPVNAGPVNAGPVNAGPANAGPANAGPVNAGPVNAGPATNGVAPGQHGPMVPASTGTRQPRKHAKWTAEEKAELTRRREAGESYATIGRALGRPKWGCESKGSALKVYKGQPQE